MNTLEVETSPTVGEIAKALAKAQQQIEGAKKTRTNPHFRSKFADLAEVIAAAEPLALNGIAVVQSPFTTATGAGCVTLLIHESGEWIRGRLELPMTKCDAQGAGAAITYARRFSLQSLANIPAEDDDGETAVRRPPAKAAPRGDYESSAAADIRRRLETAPSMAAFKVVLGEVAKSGLPEAELTELREVAKKVGSQWQAATSAEVGR